MANNNDKATNKTGSVEGTGATERPSTSTGSGQKGSGDTPISRNATGTGQGDKWSKGEEEYTQDQAEFRPGDREKGKLNNMDSVKESAKDVAGSATSAAKDVKQSAADMASDAQNKVKEVAKDAQQTLGNVTDEAKRNANAIADDQKEMAADRLHTFADTLRQTGRNLQGEDEAMIGGYAESAAGQIDRFAGYLQRNDTGALINDVRDMAHRQPEIFIAGSLAVGFLLGRFFKSSQMLPGSNQRAQDYYGANTRGYGRYDSMRSSNPPLSNYARGSYDYNRSNYGRTYGSGSAYPDLQYRDAMRGDERMREEEFRSQGYRQGATYSPATSGGYDRDASYGMQENPSGQPARTADSSTADRSTTGPGYRPDEYGNTGYRGSANETANQTEKSGQSTGETQKNTNVRGSQST